MKIVYPAIIKKQKDKRYFVKFPDLKEAVTEGQTLQEALFNAVEVLTLTLEGRIDEGMEIPNPSKVKKSWHGITPSARVQAALLMRFSKGKHTTAEIARMLETSWPAVARLEDPHHWPSLRQLERTAAVLGKSLVISLESLS